VRYQIGDLPSALHCFAVGFGERADTIWADAFRAQFVLDEATVYNSHHFIQGGQEDSP
jgi:hypothetical protein